MPDLNGKALEKKVIWRRRAWKEEAILSYCEKLGVTSRIFYLQVCSASLWQNTPNAEDSLFSTIYNGTKRFQA